MRKQAIKVLVLTAAVVLFSVGAGAQLPEKVGDAPVPSLAPSSRPRRPWSTSRRAARCANSGAIRCSRIRSPLLRRAGAAPRERQFQSAGSGVIVDARNGYIITNAHVVENADEITVTLLDDRQIKAKVIGATSPPTSRC